MVAIYGNTRVTLKKGRGLLRIKFTQWRGLFFKREKKEVSFGKRSKRKRVHKRKERKAGA